jgi:hypothetical protein
MLLAKLVNPKTKRIRALEAEVAAGRKTKQQAQTEAQGTGMKKGGKVSSASSRADGCSSSWQNQRTDSVMEHIFAIALWNMVRPTNSVLLGVLAYIGLTKRTSESYNDLKHTGN